MSRWLEHWSSFPKKYDETEFLKQVGKSVGGNEISPEQFNALVDSLMKNLNIQKSDTVLDLCCGNGLITRKIADTCQKIVGVDQSDYLVYIAKRYNSASNIEYLCSSIPDVDLTSYEKFSKIYMYEALQHFGKSQFADVLSFVEQIAERNATILFASIPDKGLIWKFYNTKERREDYFKRKANGNEAIGTWWERSSLKKIANRMGYMIEFLSQDKTLHTAHYRFDMRLKRSEEGKE